MEKLLIFKISKIRFALPVKKIIEVKPFGDIRIDHNQEWPVIGKVDVRRVEVVVIDLLAYLATERRKREDYSDSKEVVVLSLGDLIYGFIVDITLGVIEIDSRSVLPLPRYLPGVKKEFYQGLKRINSELTLLLNYEYLFERRR
ncbi:MAG: chemotaxis protein CheW [bacterium]